MLAHESMSLVETVLNHYVSLFYVLEMLQECPVIKEKVYGLPFSQLGLGH